ncbi:histone-lysine N-methyltransferase ATXR3-like [Chenopodium quinoa]|uniref:histone-lysine N-methyltransferase ATXR3-like n=1 Tax=Chenopodium quinoa TaxID=63459 RepID=UPI000B793593|nr:histone-lysine N-methyltransferase ATXR3-like [Chenopodium quinoa]
MGDGGVACVPLQPIMEKFPGSETFCGSGSGGSNNNSNGKLETKPVKRTTTKRMKLKRDAFFKKDEPGKTEPVPEKVKSSGEVENGEIGGDKVQKDEIEEGELGTLKSPRRDGENGEFMPDMLHKTETEKGEIVTDKWRRDEYEKGEFSPPRWRKGDAERYDFSSGRFRNDSVQRRDRTPEKYRKGEYEKGEFSSWRGSKDEVEKGEFIPERWHKGDVFRDDYGYLKGRRHDSSRDRERRYEHDWTPSSVRYSGEDVSPSRDFSRSGNHRHVKRNPRWEVSQERSYPKLSSKMMDDVAYKNEYSHGRGHGREHSSGGRLKRHGTDSESSDRKPYDDHGDYVSMKSRRLSNPEHYSRQSADKSFRHSNSSRPVSDRLSLRHYDAAPTRAAYDRQRRSPSYSERSPHERGRHHDHRDRTPARHERSPCYRGHRHDNRNRSPSYIEKSPNDRVRVHDRRERSSSYSGSPPERSRPFNHRQTSRSEVSETKLSDRVQSEKPTEKIHKDKDSTISVKDPLNVNDKPNGTVDQGISYESHVKDENQGPCLDVKEQPSLVNGNIEELPSMEEDMDICDTPPHVPCVASVNPGKWYYLDHYGEERGPSRLCDLKALIEGGILVSDHLVKHSDSDRWVTVENAASPVVTPNFTTIFSETVTQLVSPPEAPGNVLADVGDAEHSVDQVGMESLDSSIHCGTGQSDLLPLDDLGIDERVGALLDGVTVLPGKELEIVGEVLQMTFDHSEWEKFGILEGFMQDYSCSQDPLEQNQEEDISRHPDSTSKDTAESTSTASLDKECSYLLSEFTEWFSGRWSCKGGDWQRSEDAIQDKYFRKKVVLNDGFPLCQMPKSGYEDPRWQRKDDLYYPCQSRKLDLPSWAFSWPDERSDSSAINKSVQAKPAAVRGVKGSMMPVIRINACVVKDHGSFVSDSRLKPRGKDKYSSKGIKHYSLSTDVKQSPEEEAFHFKSSKEQSSGGSWESSIVNKPKDRVCTANDLQLHLGDWYYLDGTGHEHGPFSCSVLLKLVNEGFLKKRSSVFRKLDKVWVPVISVIKASENMNQLVGDSIVPVGVSSVAPAVHGDSCSLSNSFHSLHPHFIGYTLGKLHELVMKSYKSREFAAAINEVLDPWINIRQPRKETEKHRSSLYLQKSPMENEVSMLFEEDMHGKKRCRTLIDGDDENYEVAKGLSRFSYREPSFEDLCGSVTFCKEEGVCSKNEVGSWGLLDGHILARIFHFLRTDIKSLMFAGTTCKHWRAAVGFYKNVSVRVDLSTMGSNCSDSIIGSVMSGYNKQMIKVLVLDGCTNVTSAVLEEILQSFSCISSVDIRGCSQFEELIFKYPHVNWVREWSSQGIGFEESYSKIRSLKQMPEQSSSVSKLGHGSYMDESSGLKDYFDMVEKRGAANQAFRQNLYKRTKLLDARKSASVLARDARMKHLAMKKAGNGYRKMEEFLVLSLKDIMKGNTSDYFVEKVAEIQNKIQNGYYANRGLSSAKQDITKMCKDAIKLQKRGEAGDMESVIHLFIKLGTRLDESFKSAINRDEMMKKLRDETSGPSGHRKSKTPTERKYTSRANGSSSVNGDFDYLECSSDREIRKNLSRTYKKADMDGESSDEFVSSSDDGSNTGSASDTESDSDVRSGVTFESKEEYFNEDDAFDLTPEDREWGARMTKASLVPPVTRKYEVIEQYVIVADEAEVQRKMKVSLPENYEDKVKAQKNGSELVDMEIPEVKQYKPRKELGQEVIEQEVYGIDPYTHNLLLDSMSENVDWSLTEKHVFIEDVILRVLNKQVRQYTGSGNTPMTYPLRPVIVEILGTAKQDNNTSTLKLCEALLQAIDGRPDDNYVAYRKGLGVVCDKQGGFTKDDFVVEFLGEVYPAWKWFEKQDGIRSLQKNSKEPAPEFYNIYLERPKGDADGYDILVVDAMHKANYASRICHSCRPNCEAKVTAVSGQYQIGVYSVRPIGFEEEITFDYNSVTESKEEYEASVCLCGNQVCRGSYLNLTGEGAYQKVLKEWHGLLDKHRLLLEACELNWVSEEDYIDLGRAGLGSCLLGGLPDWLVAYSARLVRFINFERTKLPAEILRHNLEEKKKYCQEISLEMEKSDAEVQAEGVYNQRLQNLALTLDKVRYVLRCVFGNPKEAPPPLQKLSPEEMVSVLWSGEGSLVNQLLECIAPHIIDDRILLDLKSNIRAHTPSSSGNLEKDLRKSLLWLRDEVRNLPCTYKSRHDAAADLIHIYAYTKCFYKIREYKSVTSSPVSISPLDLGPKCATKLSGVVEYCKTYGENYCLGQLIYWHNQANTDPDRVLVRASRGCLSLPDIGSFYAKAQKPSRQRIYGPRTVRFMLRRMEKQPQKPWPLDRIWSFESSSKFFGSPMLDAVLNNSPLEREMVIWLKNRPAIFQAMWDR